jgi:hypothetical protein
MFNTSIIDPWSQIEEVLPLKQTKDRPVRIQQPTNRET